jgi:hypothetical protein
VLHFDSVRAGEFQPGSFPSHRSIFPGFGNTFNSPSSSYPLKVLLGDEVGTH